MAKDFYLERPEPRKRFLKAIALGLTIERSCAFAGISYKALQNYLDKAKEDDAQGLKKTKAQQFVKELEKAKSDFIMRHVIKITEASEQGTWQASAWLLERRAPKDFGQHVDVDAENVKVEFVNDVKADK